MFSFLRKDTTKKLVKKRARLLKEATDVQRTGDLKLFAEKMAEIDDLEKEIDALRSNG